MRPEGYAGPRALSIREIDLYVRYYPPHDLYFFIDVITAIDREYLRGIKADRHDRRQGR